MTASIRVAVALNFHLPDAPADRVLVADGSAWRPLSEAERAALGPARATADAASILLFALPAHIRTSFWVMMEQGRTAEDFDAFASDVGRFLTFKQLPPPGRAAFEVVLHQAGGTIEPHGLWVIVNLGDDPIVVGIPEMRVRLEPGEGCRLAKDVAANIMSPDGDAPAVLLLVREAAACK